MDHAFAPSHHVVEVADACFGGTRRGHRGLTLSFRALVFSLGHESSFVVAVTVSYPSFSWKTGGDSRLITTVCSTFAAESSPVAPIANFVDIAEKAGLTMTTVFGGKDTKKYIIETTGTGVAIFDYDNDGWPDIFLVNGTTLEGFPAGIVRAHQSSVSQQSRRNICRRDRQGRPDRDRLGPGRLRGRLRQRRMGRPLRHLLRQEPSVSQPERSLYRSEPSDSGVAGTGKAWGTGCAFVDYDRDGLLDLIVANYVDFDLSTAPAPGERASCVWKGVPVMCGPRGLPGAKNILYHNQGNGKV